MRTLRYGLACALTVMLLASLGAPASQAHRMASTTVTSIYTTSDAAWHAYDPNHAVAPPKVSSFPTGASYIAVYWTYTGATPNHTTFRVDFTQGKTVVRKGNLHTLTDAASDDILDLPNNGELGKGAYQARLYIDNVLAASSRFSVISVPTIDKSYMISGKAFDTYLNNRKLTPGKTGSFKANVDRVGIYFSYSGASGKETYYGAVYDQYGSLVHRSLNHPLQYHPDGEVALVLPADSGKYPRGSYRADIYINGAAALSVSWAAK